MGTMNDSVRHLTLADGRRLEILAGKPTAGRTLLFHGGTPTAPAPFRPLDDAAAARGIRVVQYARPGYAGSDRHPGRSVADCAADVAAILDELGVERCLTLGWSGGGPHALATAALLPDRVAAAATIAGVAPYPAEGLDWLAGMGAENVEEFGAALAGPEPLAAFLEHAAAGLAGITAEDVSAALGDLVSDEDRAALTGEFAAWTATAFRRAVSSGIWGWHDDDVAFTRPWGFALASIRVPVSVWQGEHDRMVPFAHGEWLAAHVPGVRAHLLADHGHLSIGVASLERILDDLLERADAG